MQRQIILNGDEVLLLAEYLKVNEEDITVWDDGSLTNPEEDTSQEYYVIPPSILGSLDEDDRLSIGDAVYGNELYNVYKVL